MNNIIKILFVEDSKNDCDLLVEHFKEQGFNPVFDRVETALDMVTALVDKEYDVILCDHHLPRFDVFSALALSKEKMPTLPFIVVSGSVEEDIAIRTLRYGAKDYISKNDLSRLVPAIERELIEARNRIAYIRAEADLKEKEAELRQIQKLEVVGQFAGGIAHDFNNILAIILLNSEIVLEGIEQNEEFKKANEYLFESVQQIIKAGHRGANLTRQLLAFSRRELIQPKVSDINELVRDIKKMLGQLIEENISFELDLSDDCKNIKVDIGQFEQLIMNLVVNSRDAMPKGGKLIIKTQNAFIDEKMAQKKNSNSGHYTLLQVIDSGCGMSEDTLSRIFEPFFTTKEIGKGTGLGLATVYGIVKQNNCLMFVESKLNVGTTFKIYFPQSKETVKENALAEFQHKNMLGPRTILVVEDQDDLRTTIRDTLRKNDYTVIEACNGEEALELIKSYEKPIDLILTDVIMPKIGGRELVDAAINLQSKAKFIFLSGYTDDVIIREGISSGQSHFLEKPFTQSVLLIKIKNVLMEGCQLV